MQFSEGVRVATKQDGRTGTICDVQTISTGTRGRNPRRYSVEFDDGNVADYGRTDLKLLKV